MSHPLVLINGWAMPETILAPLLTRIVEVEVTIINLTDIPALETQTIDQLIKYIHPLLPKKPFVLAGWSYGGILACAYAGVFSKNVKSLLTLATNPCFIIRSDWQVGMAQNIFADFIMNFKKAPTKTLRKFCVLCSMGSQNRKQLNEYLYKVIITELSVVEKSAAILNILGTADVRSLLAKVGCPVIHLYGDQDVLVSESLSHIMKVMFDHHEVHVIHGGHCFLIEEADSVAEVVKQYCNHEIGNTYG